MTRSSRYSLCQPQQDRMVSQHCRWILTLSALSLIVTISAKDNHYITDKGVMITVPNVPDGSRTQSSTEADEEQGCIFTKEQCEKLETLITEALRCMNSPGLSLGIVKGGVRFSKGYGLANIESGRLADRNTMFGIGSNTKIFAAATIAQLMDTPSISKNFSWQTPLSMILPNFRLNDDMRTKYTTVADFLSHRTGLQSIEMGIFSGYPAHVSSLDMCSRLRLLPEAESFRETMLYNNALYVLTSCICEYVTGKKWADLVKELIWDPLGMNETALSPGALGEANVALPYIFRQQFGNTFKQQDTQIFNLHPFEAAGAIMSSASDMTKWMKFLMEKMNHSNTPEHSAFRKLFSERILLPSDYREGLRKDMTALNVRVAYAMGLMTSNYNGYMIYSHSGDIHGYSSTLLMIPELNSAAYIAVNGPCNNDIFVSIAYMSIYIRDLLVGREPWVNRTNVCLEDSQPSNTSLESSTSAQYSINDTVRTTGLEENDSNTVTASTRLQPIQTFLGEYGNYFIGDLNIVSDPNLNCSLCLKLGCLLVADLIPTENKTVFTASARLPLAATKEWETPLSVAFLKEEASPEKEQLAKLTSDGTMTPTWFQEVVVAWGTERSVFRRNVRFADFMKNYTDNGEEKKPDTMSCVGAHLHKTYFDLFSLVLSCWALFFHRFL